jgi:hypothetical protein
MLACAGVGGEEDLHMLLSWRKRAFSLSLSLSLSFSLSLSLSLSLVTVLRLLNDQTYYPPGCNIYNAFVDMSWKVLRIITGDTIRAYGDAAHTSVVYLSLLIVFPTCSQHHLKEKWIV